MARRRRGGYIPDRAAIGPADINMLKNNVINLCGAEIDARIKWGYSLLELEEMFFTVEQRTVMKRAWELKGDMGYNAYYADSFKLPWGGGSASIHFRFDKMQMFPLKQVSQDLPVEFTEKITLAVDIASKYAKVALVAEWLDREATIGAIRHYWPTMCSLVTTEMSEKIMACTTYYKEPRGLAVMLPLIRETASTIASALLLRREAPMDKDSCISLLVNPECYDPYRSRDYNDLPIQRVHLA